MNFFSVQNFKYGSITTYSLIGINILLFILGGALAVFMSGSGVSANDITGILGGSNSQAIIQDFQIWRLITANFLHFGVIHLVINMIALYYYGEFIEKFYGSKKLLIIYLFTGICGTVLSTFFYSSASITAGASAAIYGFIGILIGNSLRKNRYSPGLPIDMPQMLPSIAIWIFAGFAIPGISGWGHLGGLLGGIILGYFFNTENNFNKGDLEDKLTNLGFFASVGLILISLGFMIISVVF